MYELAEKLFPICRSIMGEGTRETLRIVRDEYMPDMEIINVPCGTKVFDWTIPNEWVIRDAYIANSRGEKIIDFKENNLHVVGYSYPVDEYVDLEELKKHIYVEEQDEDAIPYVTSYYVKRYGFCMTMKQRDSLPEDTYHMYIDSEFKTGEEGGVLSIGEVLIPGESEQEIFFSTYDCHPSMCNDQLSGICTMTEVYKYIKSMPRRRYSYRLIIIPETIGSITYLSKNIDVMKKNIIAGFNMTCVGDNLDYSYVQTKYADTLADKVIANVLKYHYPDYHAYSFLKRGSDERQYCAPGVELPVVAFCRSKFGEFPEYHTSKDNLSFISEEGLQGAYEVMRQCIDALEANYYYRVKCLCEPQLGKRGLFPTISKRGSYNAIQVMTHFITYADGRNDIIDISNIIGAPVSEIIPIAKTLLENDLIEVVER